MGTVVAPTTLLTALLFYFGRLHVTGFFRYLGVNFTVMGLTFEDYLIRSADGLFMPLTVAAASALSALWMHRLLVGALPLRSRLVVLRVLIPVTGIAGLVLVVLAVSAARDATLFASHPETGGVSLAIGVLLLAYTARLLRLFAAQGRLERVRHAPEALALAEVGATFVLVSIGLFWAVGSYAIAVGTGRGQETERALPNVPDAVVYSEKSLSLQAPGIRETICQNPEAAYRFRYEGLKLVLQSGDQYLFLPVGWTRENGAAVLLPRSEALRIEFSRPGQARSATC